jgi:hypothetical protein
MGIYILNQSGNIDYDVNLSGLKGMSFGDFGMRFENF